MGDRYYEAMRKEIGKVIKIKDGQLVTTTVSKKPVKYTDEFKQLIKQQYLDSHPTAGNTVELCKSLADEHNITVNAVRKLLVDAQVYISQGQISTKKTTGTSTRVDKSKMQESLTSLIETLEGSVDMDIIMKLTGKASNYLSEVFSKLEKKEVVNSVSSPKGKAECIELLDKLIFEISGSAADTAITSKFTGKAALYFANILERHINE